MFSICTHEGKIIKQFVTTRINALPNTFEWIQRKHRDKEAESHGYRKNRKRERDVYHRKGDTEGDRETKRRRQVEKEREREMYICDKITERETQRETERRRDGDR